MFLQGPEVHKASCPKFLTLFYSAFKIVTIPAAKGIHCNLDISMPEFLAGFSKLFSLGPPQQLQNNELRSKLQKKSAETVEKVGGELGQL